METNTSISKRIKKNKKVFIIVSILCILGATGIVLSIQQETRTKAEVGTKTNDTLEEIEARKEKKVDKAILAATMEQVINLDDGESEGTLDIENFPENNYDIEVEIINNKQEIIYTSGKIEPGMIIRKDKLHSTLEKGKHLCSATFTAIDKDGKEVNKASAQIIIMVNK